LTDPDPEDLTTTKFLLSSQVLTVNFIADSENCLGMLPVKTTYRAKFIKFYPGLPHQWGYGLPAALHTAAPKHITHIFI
jgi:hypothetical protein